MKNIKIIVIIVVLLAGIAFFKFNSNKNIDKENNAQTTDIIDGFQQVKLSWGKLNYEPSEIRLKNNIPVKIIADTNRLTGCYRSFNIPGLGLSKYFNEKDNILEFTPEKTGVFKFTCSMGMAGGKLIVE